jgi:VanZ family protein
MLCPRWCEVTRQMQLEGRENAGSTSSQHGSAAKTHSHQVVAPTVPVIVLLLALTAIPMRLRPFDIASLEWTASTPDLIANVLGYIPVGMVLARRGFWRGLGIATLLTVVAESSQFFTMDRYPSLIDVALNVVGAMVGLFVTLRFRIGIPALPVNRVTAWLSVLAIITVLGFMSLLEWGVGRNLLVNSRGAISPGSLEAHWTFDEVVGGLVIDSAGNGLDGKLVGGTTVEGKHGMALRLDRPSECADFASPVSLRLMGSMTITAWINSKSYPVDDAAIVSSHAPGYQLDTTIDTGPRTIGFKLIGPDGKVIARYGQTELVRTVWYHVAGVYDADAKTLNVYLNGQLDDGFLLGSVPAVQQVSDRNVYVGRRSDSEQHPFTGLIDDVQIYSRALTKAEIMVAMKGQTIDTPGRKAAPALAKEIEKERVPDLVGGCYRPPGSRHALLPGVFVLVGMLLAVVCANFGFEGRMQMLFISLAVGLLPVLVAGSAVTLPGYTLLLLPALSVAGSLAVLVSMERRTALSCASVL